MNKANTRAGIGRVRKELKSVGDLLEPSRRREPSCEPLDLRIVEALKKIASAVDELADITEQLVESSGSR